VISRSGVLLILSIWCWVWWCGCDMSRKTISQRIARLKATLSDYETQLRQQSSAVSYFESLAGRQADTSVDDDACIICFEPMTRLTVTPCGHLFCNACITSCLAANGLCPTCRRSVKIDELVEVKVIDFLSTNSCRWSSCRSAGTHMPMPNYSSLQQLASLPWELICHVTFPLLVLHILPV